MRTRKIPVNWTRGFFRLWIVLSIFWIVGVAAWASTDPELALSRWVLRGGSAADSECRDENNPNWLEKEWCKGNAHTFVKDRVPIQELAVAARWYEAAAICGPLSILLLGFVVRWIAIGFRPKPNTNRAF